MHVRQQILAAVVTACTGLATTGANVANRRTFPQGTTPALNIYWAEDVPNYDDGKLASAPFHGLEVHIEGLLKGDAESVANDINEEVEAALYADQTLGGLAIGIERGPASIDQDGEGEEEVLVIDIIFTVFYRTIEGAPGVAV